MTASGRSFRRYRGLLTTLLTTRSCTTKCPTTETVAGLGRARASGPPTKTTRFRGSFSYCPSWDRTRTLLIQRIVAKSHDTTQRSNHAVFRASVLCRTDAKTAIIAHNSQQSSQHVTLTTTLIPGARKSPFFLRVSSRLLRPTHCCWGSHSHAPLTHNTP
jgi:hypothetical protein